MTVSRIGKIESNLFAGVVSVQRCYALACSFLECFVVLASTEMRCAFWKLLEDFRFLK